MHAQRNVEAVGRWSSVQVDCADPVAEATFWADVLGSTVDETIGDAPGPDIEEYGFRWRVMADPEGNEFCLILS